MSLNDRLSVGEPGEVASSPPAFAQLFHDHATWVGRCLRYLGVAESDLEDCCQEVFLVVHRRMGELVCAGAERGWIRGVCVHIAQNHRRSKRRRREDPVEDPTEMVHEAEQHDVLEQRELRNRLLQVLDQLSEEQRAVFVLYEIERLSMAEVAGAVDCPLQTAYSRLHAARARFAACIQAMQEDKRS